MKFVQPSAEPVVVTSPAQFASTSRRLGIVAALGVASVALGFLGLNTFVTLIGLALQVLFIVFFVRHFAFAIAAMRSAPPDLVHPPQPLSTFTPLVSVLVACKNEESVVRNLVASLLALDYPAERLQLIVVDDGSTDDTGALLDAMSSKNRQLLCVHRPDRAGGGKAGALNHALPRALGEVIVVFDADHRPRPDTVRRLVSHFRDGRVAAVQGRCEVHNRGDSILTRLVAIDYFAGYLVNEYGRQALFQLPAYGGANCAVRASSLRAVNGWNEASVTEDTDLSLRLLLRGERIRYDVHAVDLEEGVATVRRFWRQRHRWAIGHQQACRDYRSHVWRSTRLSRAEKAETLMFLYVFHLPIASALGLFILILWTAGVATPIDPLHAFLLWTLLFLGPLLELGAGLLVANAEPRDAWILAFFLPLFFLSMALCTKAWIDAAFGGRYQWAKTLRAADVDGVPT